jgi:hypothetical protein
MESTTADYTLVAPRARVTALRRPADLYETSARFTHALMERVPIAGTVLEPCVGPGAIATELRAHSTIREVRTNDALSEHAADTHGDATDPRWWRSQPAPEWVVSNPPFASALPIARLAVAQARRGVALLLRLSFLEPTRDRGTWLAAHPPTTLLVLPRASFTGDGRCDSVTACWCVWDREATGQTIEIVPTLEGPSHD